MFSVFNITFFMSYFRDYNLSGKKVSDPLIIVLTNCKTKAKDDGFLWQAFQMLLGESEKSSGKIPLIRSSYFRVAYSPYPTTSQLLDLFLRSV